MMIGLLGGLLLVVLLFVSPVVAADEDYEESYGDLPGPHDPLPGTSLGDVVEDSHEGHVPGPHDGMVGPSVGNVSMDIINSWKPAESVTAGETLEWIREFGMKIFWTMVEIVVVYAGIAAYLGRMEKSVSLVKGLFASFFVVFVLKGVLIGVFC